MRKITFGLGTLLVSLIACESRQSSHLDIANARDAGPTRVVKIPYPYDFDAFGGYIPLLITPNYNSEQQEVRGYRILCSDDKERAALLRAIGADENPKLAYADPSFPTEEYKDIVDHMFEQPELVCASDRQAGSQSSGTLKQDPKRPNPHLRFANSPIQGVYQSYYELGCKGLMTGLGYDPESAEVIDLESALKEQANAKDISINCPAGDPFVANRFLQDCTEAVETGDPARASYRQLMEIRGTPSCERLYKDLKDIKNLDLNDQRLTDISVLTHLTRLDRVVLSLNEIKDLAPLASSVHMRELNLASNPELTDISPLASLTNLRNLNLSDTSITQLGALRHMPRLAQLSLTENPYVRAADLDPLKYTKVRKPDLQNTTVRWEADRQTFFTNCFFLDFMEGEARKSYLKILEQLGLLREGRPMAACDILYRNVLTRQELELTGTGCLNLPVLETLQDFPQMSLRLNQYACHFQASDFNSMSRWANLKFLRLDHGQIKDLRPLLGWVSLPYVRLDLGALNVRGEACPATSLNDDLTQYCQTRQ